MASSVADMLPRSILLLRRAPIARKRPGKAEPPNQLTIAAWQREGTEPRQAADPRDATPAPRGASSPRAPTAKELLHTPGALLTRTHLRELGLERRAIDAVFRALPVVALPGYSRPMIHAEEYRQLLAQCTFHDDRVRPTRGTPAVTSRKATGSFRG